MTDKFRRDEQIEKMTFYFDGNGRKTKQEIYPSELGAQRLGVSRTVFFYNNVGTKIKMIRYYTPEILIQKGYFQGVTYFDKNESVVKEEIYNDKNKLIHLIR